MEAYLQVLHVLWKDFKDFATDLTTRIKATTLSLAEKAGRPYIYLPSSNTSKEALAKAIARKDQVEEGLIAIFGCVEPCRTYFMRGNKATKKLELKLELGKCQHFYFYPIHPKFGFMHMRLQSWFPFLVHICLNGREWLSRQMDQHEMEYQRKENCFTWISHVKGAQRLMEKQLETRWPDELDKIVKENHPLSKEICRPLGMSYYWGAQESEYATDVMFHDAKGLARIYPGLVHHAISSFSSPDVMRFLGHHVPVTNPIRANFQGEVISDLKVRPEGIRVKHSVNGNSIKIYDKQGSVLRVETTINRAREFRVYRTSEKDPKGKKSWRILRHGFADLPRRAEVSHKANERYLQALGSVSGTLPLLDCVEGLCRPVTKDGRKYRALNPWSPSDAQLLQAVSRGEFTINGFRNRDIRTLLFKSTGSHQEERRRAGLLTRRFALLRAHGLIRKVSGTHRYILTEKGRISITGLLAAHKADIEQLTKMAA
jgi:hypothetical protein